MNVMVLAAFLPFSIVMEGGLLADGYGQYMQRVCSKFMKVPSAPRDLCQRMVVDRYRSLFPETALPIEECVKRPEVEALMWGAVYDRGWADRYYAKIADLCDGEALK